MVNVIDSKLTQSVWDFTSVWDDFPSMTSYIHRGRKYNIATLLCREKKCFLGYYFSFIVHWMKGFYLMRRRNKGRYSFQSPLWLGIGVKTSNIKMMIFFDTCFTVAWQWSILDIVCKVHPNLKAVCSTGHIGANRILCWLHLLGRLAAWSVALDRVLPHVLKCDFNP